MAFALNILGEPLDVCSCDPMTGFFRTGECFTGPQDRGSHTVCALMTEAFLDFSVAQGNDLVTPRPEYDFPGLKPGDHWCVCASRWLDAFEAGVAPPVDAAATHEAAMRIVPRAVLLSMATPRAAGS